MKDSFLFLHTEQDREAFSQKIKDSIGPIFLCKKMLKP